MVDSSSSSSLLSILVSAKKWWFNHSAYSASLITYRGRENIQQVSILCFQRCLRSVLTVTSVAHILNLEVQPRQCITYVPQHVHGFNTMSIVLDYFVRLHKPGCSPAPCRFQELPDRFPFRRKVGRPMSRVYSPYCSLIAALTQPQNHCTAVYSSMTVQLHSLYFHFA